MNTPEAINELRRMSCALRGFRQNFLFSQRQLLGRAIVAIDEITGDKPPLQDVPQYRCCSCGRARLASENDAMCGLRYELQGVNAIGTNCPHCHESAQDILNRRACQEGEHDDDSDQSAES